MKQRTILWILVIFALINFSLKRFFDHFIVHNILSPIILIVMTILVIMYFVIGKKLNE